MGRNGEFIYVSPSTTRVLGYRSEELVGRNAIELMHPDEAKLGEATLHELLERPDALIASERRLRHKDGAWRWCEIIRQNLLDELGVGAIVANFRDVTERRRTEEQLAASREHLRALAASLNTVREEERTDLAREVHDTLGQALTGLKMDLAWLNRRFPDAEVSQGSSLRAKVCTMAQAVDATIQIVQHISARLRPALLDDLGLEAALEWQAQEFQERTDIECEFVSSLGDVDLPQEEATAVFRIFQEALANVARHAGANHVSIILEENAGALVLVVQDTGRGITAEEISSTKSLGILGMQERALGIAGEVIICGIEGKGTTVTVRVPLGNSEMRSEARGTEPIP